ncbi:MAG: PIN domain-containing protein, partial [Chloroflexota bacterium]
MTAKSVKKPKNPELKIAFDTNAIYSDSASALFMRRTAEFINNNSGHADLTVQWYLPEIVVLEREYQMFESGKKLLPGIEKLEKLMGYNLGITEDILHLRVKEAIDKELKAHKINVINLDTNMVNWQEVILRSVHRRPPFDPGDKEKGFRDAIVIESLFQMIEVSPTTPKICRIAFISEDKLMNEAANEKIGSRSNIRLLETLDDLQSLINILISETTEEFVRGITQKAKELFFSEGSSESLYYKENIRDAINRKFKDVLQSLPNGADKRKNGDWFISSPTFIKKEGQRVHWNTKITVEANAYKTYISRGSSPGLDLQSTNALLTTFPSVTGALKPLNTTLTSALFPEIPQHSFQTTPLVPLTLSSGLQLFPEIQ